MSSSAEDRVAIQELIALHGHHFDDCHLDRLHELFTEDVVYDLEDFGAGQPHGIVEIREAATQLGEHNPLGHHTTNFVVAELGEHVAHVRSSRVLLRRRPLAP